MSDRFIGDFRVTDIKTIPVSRDRRDLIIDVDFLNRDGSLWHQTDFVMQVSNLRRADLRAAIVDNIRRYQKRMIELRHYQQDSSTAALSRQVTDPDNLLTAPGVDGLKNVRQR